MLRVTFYLHYLGKVAHTVFPLEQFQKPHIPGDRMEGAWVPESPTGREGPRKTGPTGAFP